MADTKIYVQWSRLIARDWEELDSSEYGKSLEKPVPVGGETLDDQEGWVSQLNCQGVQFIGYDHYAVESLPGGGCKVTAWRDDPDDPGPKYAREFTFLPLAPDPNIGGKYNTRQSQVVYGDAAILAYYASIGPVENTVVRPLADFVPPPSTLTRHGITLPDALHLAHEQAASPHGWREWTEGVPAQFIIGGEVRG